MMFGFAGGTPTRTRTLAFASLLVAHTVLVVMLIAPNVAQAAPADARITWQGKRWFATGANLPWYRWKCDFGCRNSGVHANRVFLGRTFAKLNRNGVKVVRWYVFPDDAWQIQRDPDTGTPVGIGANTYRDFDMAVKLAAQHDLYLSFVLFSDTRTIPPAWLNTQREQLATTLGPLFRRYGKSNRVLAWELFNEPEHGIDAGTVALADVQATVQRLASAIHARARARVTVGSRSVDDLGKWAGLGLDFYAPHWWSSMTTSPTCAFCTTASQLRQLHGGLDGKPIVIGAVNTGTSTAARQRYFGFYRKGYAGMWVWSVFPRSHPSWESYTGVRYREALRFIYAARDIGPRSRPLNPCFNPLVSGMRCPDLRMARPFGLFVSRRSGRTRLHAGNSIDSIGRGPAELFGRRSGRYSMNAVQRIWRTGGRRYVVNTNARLYFKYIPGQGRYWKYRNAAHFSLYRLNSAGKRVRRVRKGPKAIYCLRDLQRRNGRLAGSPRSRYYPGCSRNGGARSVRLGTSVGWSDVYPATYHEQWIDVTGLRGCHAYEHIADPLNGIWESNEGNNSATIVVRLPYTGSNAGCRGGGASASSASGGSYSF